MKFALHYQDTDHCTYWSDSVLFIEGESIESVFVELSDLHDSHVKDCNLDVDTEEYQHGHIDIAKDIYIPLTDISSSMTLETIEDYIKNIETIKIGDK